MVRASKSMKGINIKNGKYQFFLKIEGKYQRLTVSPDKFPPCKENDRIAPAKRAEIQKFINTANYANANEYLLNPIKTDTPVYVSEGLIQYGKRIRDKKIKGEMSHTTVRKYERYIDITAKQLDGYTFQQLADDHRPINKLIRDFGDSMQRTKSVREAITPLRSAFQKAFEDQVVSVNIMTSISIASVLDRRDTKPAPKVYKLEDVFKILANADIWRDLFQFWFFQGLRSGEVYALRWPWVDFKKGGFWVKASISEGIEKAPKTESGFRWVPLTKMGLMALKRQERLTRFRPDQFIWVHPRTEQPITDYRVTMRALMSICKASEVEYIRPYNARHTCASHLLEGGENKWDVIDMMGWKDDKMISTYRTSTGNAKTFKSDFANIEEKG